MDGRFKEGFSNSDEELAWQFFCWNGNPYIIQGIVKQRNDESNNSSLHPVGV